MATDLQTAPVSTLPIPAAPATDDIGFDRDLVLMLAKVPLTAILWTVAAYIGHLIWGALDTATEGSVNYGSIVVICIGMVLAAVIDGYAFKVPNWLTLSLVVAGWYLGLLHTCGVMVDAGQGGIGQALLGTLIGFAVLFPALAIGGMGEGDVKMTMGFGAWMGAFFGDGSAFGMSGAAMIWWSFALGVMIGGVFGLVIMVCRRQFENNGRNFREILTDLQTLVTHGPEKAAARANSRRKEWVRLPYGVPLCVGFLAYLWFRLIYAV